MNEAIGKAQAKVSVIIPCYNVEAFLPECLESVLSQTLKELEIICVDDGSTDSSGAILSDFAERDSRITVLTKSNGGQSSARNLGVRSAHGKYLYFMDSDDLLTPQALGELFELAEKDGLDNIYFDASVFFDPPELKYDNLNYVNYYERSGAYPEALSGCELFASMHANKDYRPSPCLQFIRREFYIEAGLSFYEGIILEDNLFTFCCITQAKAVRHIDKAYYQRRVRENSTMSGEAGVKRFNGYFTCLIKLLDYVEGRDFGVANEEAARFILSIYRNAATEYHRLPMDMRPLVMERESIRDEYLFSMILGNIAGSRLPAGVKACSGCEIANSFSYKLGRVLTFLPRKLYRACLCIKDNGFVYTVRLLFSKLRRH